MSQELEDAAADVRKCIYEIHLVREELSQKLRNLTEAEARLYEIEDAEKEVKDA